MRKYSIDEVTNAAISRVGSPLKKMAEEKTTTTTPTRRRRTATTAKPEWQRKIEKAEAEEIGGLLELFPAQSSARIYYIHQGRQKYLESVQIAVLKELGGIEQYVQGQYGGGSWHIHLMTEAGRIVKRISFDTLGKPKPELLSKIPNPAEMIKALEGQPSQYAPQSPQSESELDRLRRENEELRRSQEFQRMRDEILEAVGGRNPVENWMPIIQTLSGSISEIFGKMGNRQSSESVLMPILTELLKSQGSGNAKELKALLDVAKQLPELLQSQSPPVIAGGGQPDILSQLISGLMPALGGKTPGAPQQTPVQAQQETLRDKFARQTSPNELIPELLQAAASSPEFARNSDPERAITEFLAKFPELESARMDGYKAQIKSAIMSQINNHAR